MDFQIKNRMGFCFLLLFIYACGGGGGSGGSANSPPLADAGLDQTQYLTGSETRTITLSGTATDSDGTIVSQKWMPINGTDASLSGANTSTATFTVDATEQTYTFSYTVTDDDGASDSDEVRINVINNSAPTADAGENQNIYLSESETRLVTLSGTDSDADGNVVDRQWTQTGGETVVLTFVNENTATFTVDATTAAYTFAYTVTDDDGVQTSDTVAIYVSRTLFSDSFATGGGSWSYIDDAGNGDIWAVNAGQLLQSGYDVDHIDASTYQLGTFAVPDTFSTANTDYRISVDITPLINTSGASQWNDVGIMFRYVNATNYYRVSMNAKYGFTRFEKRSGGSFETLAVNAIGYAAGETLNMQAEVNGNTIVVWIDYVPIFAIVDDSPIASGKIALYCQDTAKFDNVRITEPSLEPVVAIATPLAYSVALTEGDTSPLSVKAVALNPPSGGSIGFTLGDGAEVSVPAADSSGYYTTQYTGVGTGDHEIMAVLRDGTGSSVASDINSTVGVGGDYYLTIGDSITTGVGDLDPSDNESADGRIVAIQGFQAPLADLLTDKTGRPQIVFNEAIPGDTAAGVNEKIDSILERHPGANKVLLMIGTNDSNSAVTPTQYGNSLDSIATTINGGANGRTLWIASPMPTYTDNPPTTLDTTRNGVIENYIVEINGVVYNHLKTSAGPNFYNIFGSLSPTSYYYNDNLHPNDAGYGVMADEWRTTLP